jgi:hypothetical protein
MEPLRTSCVIVESARKFAQDMQPVGTCSSDADPADPGTIDESLSRFGCARDYRDNFLAHDSPNASSQRLQPGQTGREHRRPNRRKLDTGTETDRGTPRLGSGGGLHRCWRERRQGSRPASGP